MRKLSFGEVAPFGTTAHITGTDYFRVVDDIIRLRAHIIEWWHPDPGSRLRSLLNGEARSKWSSKSYPYYCSPDYICSASGHMPTWASLQTGQASDLPWRVILGHSHVESTSRVAYKTLLALVLSMS